MALTQDDFVGAVARLNELTRLQVIKWQPCNPPTRPPRNVNQAQLERHPNRAEPKSSFEAIHDGRIMRITQYEWSLSRVLGNPSFQYELEIRTEAGDTQFVFPPVEGLADLFRSIETQELDIEGFIKSLVTR